MSIRPILSALLRNKTGAILVALQIALTLAVVVNSVYIIVQRIETIGRPTGIDEHNIFLVNTLNYASDFPFAASIREDLGFLNGQPGVVAATSINNIPLSGGGSSTMYYSDPGAKGQEVPGNYFEVNERGIDALGVHLDSGRGFSAAVIRPPVLITSEFVPELVMTRVMAKQLFPDKEPLGQTVYDSLSQPARIVGIIETMHGSWVGWDKVGNVALHPVTACCNGVSYLVRTQPGERDRLMKVAEEKLSSSTPGRIVNSVRTLDFYKSRSYEDDRNMAIYLVIVIVLLVAVASLGIFGLATFNVQSRTKQIGTRRAIGARRIDIVQYFLIENWLITTCGVVAGCVLGLGVGYWLHLKFELPLLNLFYLVGGVLGLWCIGLLATLVPARRASRVSPAVATRTV
ncbi:MAG: ABC transporter permease [Steroidobacterales bacterium]